MLLLVVIIFAIGNNIFLILKTNANFNVKTAADLKYFTSYIDQQINSFYQVIYSFRDNSDVAYFSSLNKMIFTTQQTKQISNVTNGIKQTMISNKSISDIFIGFSNTNLVVNKDGTMSFDTFDKSYNKFSFSYVSPNLKPQNKFSINQDIKEGEIHAQLDKDFHLYYYKTKKHTIVLKTNNSVLNEQLTLFAAPQEAYFVIANPKGDVYATNCFNPNSPTFNELNSSEYQKNSDIINDYYNLTTTAFFSKRDLHYSLLNVNIVSITLCVLLVAIITWILYSLKRSLYDPIEKLIYRNGNFFNKTVIDEYELLEESINKYSVIAKEYENYRKDVDYELEVNTLNRLLSDAAKATNETMSAVGKHATQMYCILSVDFENKQGAKNLVRHTVFENTLKQNYHVVSVLSMTYSSAYIIYLTNKNSYQSLIDHVKKTLDEYIGEFNICGISEIFDDISNTKIAYSQSQKALVSFDPSNYDSHVSIYKLQRSSNISLPNTTDIQNKIINSTLSLNYIEVETAFRELSISTDNLTINQKRKIYLQLYDYLCIFLANKDIDSNEFFNEDNINIEEILLNTLNTNLLLDILLSCYQRGIFSASDGKNNDLLSLITKFIDDNIDKNISLLQLADEMKLSYTYMSKYFKRKMNMSFVEYVQIKKIRAAQTLLQNTDLNIVDIAEKMGFNTANTFFRTFKKVTGVTPNEYRQQ